MFIGTPATFGPMPTDADLLRRIADRDERAFELLYDRHRAAAHATARRVCRSGQLADDVLQDAFLAVWRDAPAFRPRPGGPEGWLHTIVRNRGLDLVRQTAVRERHVVLDERALLEAPSERPSPHDAVAAAQEASALRLALAALPAPQREVLVLAYFEQLTQAEIAVRLSLALGTVKGRARLGLRRLATAMNWF